MKRLFSLLIALSLLAAAGAFLAPGPANAGTIHSITLPDVTTKLKPGPGEDKTAALCSICHSLDYIPMQPPFSRAKWKGVVNKMIKVFGAPVNEEDAKTIIDYLAAEYGTGK